MVLSLRHRVLLVCLSTLLLICVAEWLFRRLEAGELFLFPFAFDRPASAMENADAIRSGKLWHWPAIGSLLVLGGLAARLRLPPASSDQQSNRPVEILLVFAALTDLATTLRFFHLQSIELEVHPAIRLFGYAFGRTSGPVLAKLIQLAGIALLGKLWPDWRTQIYVGAALLMLFAAAHNMLNVF